MPNDTRTEGPVTEGDLQQRAEAIRRKKLETMGVADQFDLWRESMPDTRMSDQETYDTFINAHQIEEAANAGTVSVSTGGAVVPPDTDIPTPSPEDDGDTTGAAGDTSKGGDGESDDLKLVEDMWQPPEEAIAENYEAPSTADMANTPEWLENAKKLHKFMGSPTSAPEESSKGSTFFAPPQLMKDEAKPQMSDQEISQWAKDQLSLFNWNVASTMSYAQKIMSSEDQPTALAFLNLINMYDHSDGGAVEFSKAIGGVATDPTTYVGLGVGSVAAKGAARATAKAGLKKQIQMAITAGSAGAVEGGMLAGGYDLTVQNVEQEAGAREDLDVGRAAKATGVGVAAGTLIGGGLGHLVGRHMDKLALAADKEAARVRGADTVAEKQIADGLEVDQMIEMLRSSAKATEAEGTRDAGAAIAMKWLGNQDSLPRKADGSIDKSKVAAELDQIQIAEGMPLNRRDVSRVRGSALEESLRPENKGRRQTDIVAPLEPEGPVIKMRDEGAEPRMGGSVKEMAKELGIEEPTVAGEGNTTEYTFASKEDAAKFAEKWNVKAKPTPKTDAAANDPDMGTLREREARNKVTPLPTKESLAFAERISEMDKAEQLDIVPRTTSMPGSRIKDLNGKEYEIVGRTENGWFRAKTKHTGEEVNLRKKQFIVEESHPPPEFAGPMELKPFTASAAKIIRMNEDVVSGKLKEVKTTHAEQRAMADELRQMGVKITEKNIATHWTPAELMFLRDTYNAQANGMADLARLFETETSNGGKLTDQQLAMFNEAHTQFVATRDLFFGTSGNAARQLNILRSRPTDDVYDFTQSLMDSISMQGGRANTERAIGLMAKFAKESGPGMNSTRGVSKMSDKIWGKKFSSALLNVRYNMMLSSWRTHFRNFTGNSASGIYQHLMVSPVRMGINNMAYARDLAKAVIDPKFTPDPADRVTRHQWFAELRGHYEGFTDSMSLAKEIAMGRDIGEGKVWNELGLRYNVINVPDSMFGKLGTTPVRMLEAGDAFFKNQYYSSKMHELASTKARVDQVHNGADYKERYDHWLENPDSAMERLATEFAQKQTYTNDPSIYGGVLAALAKGVSEAQNRSLMVNMIVPFVRTPANLLSYSMEMIGANILLSPSKTFNSIMKGSAQESQEAMAKLTIAAGLWLAVGEMYENGSISGTGPTNWEEKQVWEAAGWQPNSVKIYDKWYGVNDVEPVGQSLASIASIYDYYAMTQQQEKPAMEWIGAGLLYTADMLIDESYLSTASDLITAISAKEESRARSSVASMINSIVIPNLLRDFRKPADATMRVGTSTNLLDQVKKQAMNASPWHSADLPPKRDWKGDIVNYYGNVYARGLIPFNVRDSKDSDPASMALAYARIPVSAPDKTIDWPGGRGDAIDLFAMDNGGGYVYNKYLELMGGRRKQAVDLAMRTSAWSDAVEQDQLGPGSMGELVLRKALGIGSRAGRLEMLKFLVDHSGDNNLYTRKGPDGGTLTYQIQHQISVDTYKDMIQAIIDEGMVPDDLAELKQYLVKEPQSGPEFFKQ